MWQRDLSYLLVGLRNCYQRLCAARNGSFRFGAAWCFDFAASAGVIRLCVVYGRLPAPPTPLRTLVPQ